jgi:hypothetical protein
MGGLDIVLSNSLSVPVEVSLLWARPEESIVFAGISVGLDYHFGKAGRSEED